MRDYREQIKTRAKIAELELTEELIEEFNTYVNKSIAKGYYVFDALDYCYFRMLSLKKKKIVSLMNF